MAFVWDLLSYLGGTAVLVAAAAFLARLLVQHRLDKDISDYKAVLDLDAAKAQSALQRDLEDHKAALSRANAQALDQARFEFDKELIARRGEIDFARDAVKYANESQQQRQARLHAQVQRWANPIRQAIDDLDHRLANIMEKGGYRSLAPQWKAPPQWSADHDYFMSSTMYYFAQFFCWVRLMQMEIGYELFRSSGEMEAFAAAIEDVGNPLGQYPYRPPDSAPSPGAAATDRQVFRLQQRAIGELLLAGPEAGKALLSYRDFVDRLGDEGDPRWLRHLAPLRAFLRDLGPQDDVRWLRLQAMRTALAELRTQCNQIMGLA